MSPDRREFLDMLTTGANDVLLVIRAWRSWNTLGPWPDEHRDEKRPEAIPEIGSGAKPRTYLNPMRGTGFQPAWAREACRRHPIAG